jgi:hypothetical protein
MKHTHAINVVVVVPPPDIKQGHKMVTGTSELLTRGGARHVLYQGDKDVGKSKALLSYTKGPSYAFPRHGFTSIVFGSALSPHLNSLQLGHSSPHDSRTRLYRHRRLLRD